VRLSKYFADQGSRFFMVGHLFWPDSSVPAAEPI
jgi:hypothetical protein